MRIGSAIRTALQGGGAWGLPSAFGVSSAARRAVLIGLGVLILAPRGLNIPEERWLPAPEGRPPAPSATIEPKREDFDTMLARGAADVRSEIARTGRLNTFDAGTRERIRRLLADPWNAGYVKSLLASRGLDQLTPRLRHVVLDGWLARPLERRDGIVAVLTSPFFMTRATPDVRERVLRRPDDPAVWRAAVSSGFTDLSHAEQLALLNRAERASNARSDERLLFFLGAWGPRSTASAPDRARVLAILRDLAAGAPVPGDQDDLDPVIVGAQGFVRLADDEVGQLARVSRTADLGRRDMGRYQVPAMQAIAKLLAIAPDGTVPLLSRDFKGGTLLASLHQLNAQPLADDLIAAGVPREDVLRSAIVDVADTPFVVQGNRGTCTAAGISVDLLGKSHPAEYARLFTGLALAPGEVTLANGATLVGVSDAYAEDRSGRTPSARILQASLMNHVGDWWEWYSNVDDTFYSPIGRTHDGLGRLEIDRLLEAVSGRPHEILVARGAVEGGRPVSPAALVDALAKRSSQDTVVDLAWDRGGHLITVEAIRDGRVYYRDTNRPGDEPVPGARFPRRADVSWEGRMSMSVEDFLANVWTGYFPE